MIMQEYSLITGPLQARCLNLSRAENNKKGPLRHLTGSKESKGKFEKVNDNTVDSDALKT